MALPFTVEQFYGVFRDYNAAVWPVQWVLVALALAAIVAALRPRPGSSMAVSAILGLLWAWIAVAYHLVFFTRLSPAAYGFAAVSAAGAGVFVWQGVVRRRLTFRWTPGLKATAGVTLIFFALMVYPVWSAYAGHPYPATPTFGLPCPTTIFTIGLLCFAVPPTPRSTLIVPVLWCGIGAQAAFLLDVHPDLGLIAAGLVGIALLLPSGRPLRTRTSITRRQFAASTPWLAASPLVLSGCSQESAAESYETVAERTWQMSAVNGDASGAGSTAQARELVRCATLAPSSHNTQCWKFALAADGCAITLLPDLARRCPAVDPDDHHVFVSLGCATENLIQAALAHGLKGEAQFDAAGDAVRVSLEATRAQTTPLFVAIAQRQCTHGDYDGKPLSTDELTLLQRAGSSDSVRLLLLTERSAMEQVLGHVIQGNTAQMADAAFVKELKAWIRFNGADAVRTGDGLYSASSGNPNIPTWVGDVAFRWVFTPKGENDKYARQVRSSAGIAVFVGQAADKAHWVEVGRCYERFALQATALGIRNAFLNQPVEVAAVRPPFATALGLTGQRPDLVARFGRGPALPRSLRRPVESVLV